MKFGENLKKLRKENHLSQEYLAEKVGVSRQSVSKWENSEAYPEMNNILELCKIFHCHINDLVHANMSDINKLDNDIKMKVVKLRQEEQRKMKGISKAIYLISRIGKITISICQVIVIIIMLLTPFIANKIQITNNYLMYNQTKIGTLENAEELRLATTFLENHSNLEIIVYTEIIFLCLVLSCFIIYRLLGTLEKLFQNINKGVTPFTKENVNHIKAIANYLIIYLVFQFLSGLIMEFLMQINLGIELEVMDVVLILIIYSIAYIFEYGYRIQLDCQGVMYDDKKSKD